MATGASLAVLVGFAPSASLTGLDGRPVDWPATHLLLVARRPEQS